MVATVNRNRNSGALGSRFAPTPHTRFRIESVGLFLAATLFIIASHSGGWLGAFDRLIYDAVIARIEAPMATDVVVVGIDEQSLAGHGPWPWNRATQAQLISRISSFDPRLLIVDIIYSNTTPDDDALLEAARQVPQLGLPVMVDALAQGAQHIEVLPFPKLLAEADIVGHVQINIDPDAIVRGTHLYQGVGEPHWPHLMLATAQHLGHRVAAPCPVVTRTPLIANKCAYVRFPFAGPPGTYPHISAASLLRDDYAAADRQMLLQRALQGKVVLLGMTALGGGDWVSSPLGFGTSPLSGVEFNANLLGAMVNGTLIKAAPDLLVVLLSIALIAVSCVALPRQQPKQALITSFAMALLPIVVTSLCLILVWVHVPLASATLAAVLIYPLWSWRRAEIAWAFVDTELQRIDDEAQRWQFSGSAPTTPSLHAQTQSTRRGLALLLGAEITFLDSSNSDEHNTVVQREAALSPAEQLLIKDSLAQLVEPAANERLPAERLAAQIGRLQRRAEALREGREMGLAGLDSMSNGALIISALGQVHFVNKAARKLLHWQAEHELLPQLEQIQPPLGQSWTDIWRAVILDQRSIAFESQLPAAEQTGARPVFVIAEPLDQSAAYASAWVIALSDLSEIRQAQAGREEALAFLSHDLRSPLTSILALIQQSHSATSDEPSTLPQTHLLEDIKRYTQRGLSTSEQFLQLSRLQLHSQFETYPLDIEQVVHNAVEQVYFLAKDKLIELHTQIQLDATQTDGLWLQGNGELLERALVNLLGNAIKYSDRDTRVTIGLTADTEHVRIVISDQGPGIPAPELPHIFEPFFRSADPKLAQQRGAGLGLRFVKTVIDRHGGEVSVASQPGQGSEFKVRLPLNTNAPALPDMDA